jgi:excisionase family DNA binding protein
MDTTSSALKWHTVAEAAQLTGTSRRTLWRRVSEGEMPSKLEGGRRLIGLKPSDMSEAATGLASAAVAAAGAFRAADGMTEAIRAIEASAGIAVAQAERRADEAARRAEDAICATRRLEVSLSRWRVAAVAVPAGIAVALLALKDPAQAPANVSQSSQAAQHDIEVDVPVVPLWHPPMALPESTEQAPQVVLHQRR